MAINRISCPECGAGLKSASGFKVGQTVSCPKCEIHFVVEDPEEEEDETPKKPARPGPKGPPPGLSKTAPLGKKKPVKAATEEDEDDEEEEEEKPKKKKKKKKRDDEEQWSYRNSWIRYAILAILIVIMCVLGYMLHLKQEREKQSYHRETPTTGPKA